MRCVGYSVLILLKWSLSEANHDILNNYRDDDRKLNIFVGTKSNHMGLDQH